MSIAFLSRIYFQNPFLSLIRQGFEKESIASMHVMVLHMAIQISDLKYVVTRNEEQLPRFGRDQVRPLALAESSS